LRDALHEIAGTSYSREVAADIAKQALEQGDVGTTTEKEIK